MAEQRSSKLRATLAEWSDVPLRAALAATFIVHGWGKLFGGMEGFTGFVASLGVPNPALMAWAAVLAELGGGVLLALGLATRLAALGHMCVMAVAITRVHWSQGFKAHGVGGDAAGFEWQAALFCMALCLLMRGAGPLSLDRLISRRLRKKS